MLYKLRGKAFNQGLCAGRGTFRYGSFLLLYGFLTAAGVDGGYRQGQQYQRQFCIHDVHFAGMVVMGCDKNARAYGKYGH